MNLQPKTRVIFTQSALESLIGSDTIKRVIRKHDSKYMGIVVKVNNDTIFKKNNGVLIMFAHSNGFTHAFLETDLRIMGVSTEQQDDKESVLQTSDMWPQWGLQAYPTIFQPESEV